jgi:competence protein ComEC
VKVLAAWLWRPEKRLRLSSHWTRNFAGYFALSCWIGSLCPISVPMAIGPIALCVGVLSRRRAALLVLGGLSVAVMSFHAREGVQPVESREWVGVVQLVSDPQTYPGRVVADVDSDLGRLELTATGRAASVTRQAFAGRRLRVGGTLRLLTHPERAEYRHVRMALSVSEASLQRGADLWRIPVDFVRNAILNGGKALPAEQRPVYSGFVIGDDRGSSDDVVRAFENSGLSHLLVVSGENVIFIIALATPLASRLPRRPRIFVLTLVLLLFAAVTRFEPSVLRATAMALLAVVGAASGRPLNARRRVAVAVALLLLIDPLLVESLGFRLSVAATVGITLLASGLARRLRGPNWLRQVLAITIAAQIFVAPLVIPSFGPMPLASLPANVLAEPVAGFVMMWGSSVGLLAGVLGGWPAVVLQAPVRLGVWWIMTVAKWCSGLPLPRLTLSAIVALSVGAATVARVHSSQFWQRRTRLGRVSAG